MTTQAELFGADAVEWLRRWDEGRAVWSIEMGGLGPGYEQAIQACAAELVRLMLMQGYESDKLTNGAYGKRLNAEVADSIYSHAVSMGLGGLSGAQFGAAKNLAWFIYSDGPIKVMNDPRVKDRHIQVSNRWPGANVSAA